MMTTREEQTVEELRDELRARDLKVSGTKDELLDRLDEADEAGDDGGDGGGGPPDGRTTSDRSRLATVVARIGQDLGAVTGLAVERVTGLARADDGWHAEVDVVEVSRVPPSTDVLATYAVTTDADGELLGFERVRRFRRSEGSS